MKEKRKLLLNQRWKRSSCGFIFERVFKVQGKFSNKNNLNSFLEGWCSEYFVSKITYNKSNHETYCCFIWWNLGYTDVLFDWNFRLVWNGQHFWCILLIIITNNEHLNEHHIRWYIEYRNRCAAIQQETNFQSWRYLWISSSLRMIIQSIQPFRWNYSIC